MPRCVTGLFRAHEMTVKDFRETPDSRFQRRICAPDAIWLIEYFVVMSKSFPVHFGVNRPRPPARAIDRRVDDGALASRRALR
jgi:hypothetical protein